MKIKLFFYLFHENLTEQFSWNIQHSKKIFFKYFQQCIFIVTYWKAPKTFSKFSNYNLHVAFLNNLVIFYQSWNVFQQVFYFFCLLLQLFRLLRILMIIKRQRQTDVAVAHSEKQDSRLKLFLLPFRKKKVLKINQLTRGNDSIDLTASCVATACSANQSLFVWLALNPSLLFF